MKNKFTPYQIQINPGAIVQMKPAGKKWSNPEIQKAVGGYYQIINLGDAVMFVDEDGKQKGYSKNTLATTLAEKFISAGDFIVGNVLVSPLNLV